MRPPNARPSPRRPIGPRRVAAFLWKATSSGRCTEEVALCPSHSSSDLGHKGHGMEEKRGSSHAGQSRGRPGSRAPLILQRDVSFPHVVPARVPGSGDTLDASE